MDGADQNDDRYLFGDTRMREIAKALGVTDDDKLGKLQLKLRAFGEEQRKLLGITPNPFLIGPTNLSRTKQVEWLQVNILRPIKKLRDALSNDENFFH